MNRKSFLKALVGIALAPLANRLGIFNNSKSNNIKNGGRYSMGFVKANDSEPYFEQVDFIPVVNGEFDSRYKLTETGWSLLCTYEYVDGQWTKVE